MMASTKKTKQEQTINKCGKIATPADHFQIRSDLMRNKQQATIAFADQIDLISRRGLPSRDRPRYCMFP
jgi:hypothetical protein